MVFASNRTYFQLGGLHVVNEHMNFKTQDFTVFLLLEFDGPYIRQKRHVQ